jgi:hypothetical protein
LQVDTLSVTSALMLQASFCSKKLGVYTQWLDLHGDTTPEENKGSYKQGKVHPSTGHEGPDGELGGYATPRQLYPWEREPVPTAQ